MATIEPRLIHLLNGSTTPQLPHADLPALHPLPRLSSDRPLPALEPGANSRISSYPLRPLWGDVESSEQEGLHAGAREDGHDPSDDAAMKKRTHVLNGKEDFVQLPQPMKKQKATQNALVMPPIINGLHEPPPYTAMFPPISSTSFSQNDGGSKQLLHDIHHSHERKSSKQSSPETDKFGGKIRKRAVKPRRKWSEEETKHLLLGVNRHGVGKWTCILEDPDFSFNDRTAGDLKDRFRTCCPDELRTVHRGSHPVSPSMPSADTTTKAKSGIMSENILIEEEGSHHSDEAAQQDVRPKKSRAHRKKMTDLAELGIHGPFKKSHRRERRPFTDNDDREILEGLDIYGPAWTKIQRDSRFNFSARQPTDLRDRVRNKYPELYQRIEKGTFQPREARASAFLEPSVTISFDNSMQRAKVAAMEPQMTGSNRREDMPRWTMQTESHEDNAPPISGGEMGISRLLLDDSRASHGPPRRVKEAFSGSSSPSGTASEARS
ncbi:hypothetical protein B0I35DRAFT_454462 [Stachybotrys elegans]|uniref:Myb-like domain-containing protein n=1 Tax=Stachybotrys elegans TaxID=80388 RepID=A0A8K0SFB2_9HYPO|nr:hypothetical protein B0I35DRAFT_454462 [Stachybotrys elegans]